MKEQTEKLKEEIRKIEKCLFWEIEKFEMNTGLLINDICFARETAIGTCAGELIGVKCTCKIESK